MTGRVAMARGQLGADLLLDRGEHRVHLLGYAGREDRVRTPISRQVSVVVGAVPPLA